MPIHQKLRPTHVLRVLKSLSYPHKYGVNMKQPAFGRRIASAVMAAMLFAMPLASIAQTRISMPKNKYSVQDDVKLGNDAARQVERQFPLISDADAAEYLERIGQRLVAAIPSQFQEPAFNYRFRWVNASDLNAFALPGGPMYVDRGMLESAHNEGELAGVMAHELSHVVLRHATAQQTKATSAGSTLRNLGLILGGAVLGGQAGAQLGAVFAQGFALKYSREYESQADTLGAQIMASAGYDPRDLANVFQTIASQSRGGTPQWLSSHPDPGNRYQKINQEAQYLRVTNPIKVTRDFERVQAKFRAMPRARSMAEIQQGGGTYNNGTYSGGRNSGGNNGGYNGGSTAGGYARTVPYPSSQMKAYSAGNVSFGVPSNWEPFSGGSQAAFAPQGAYGDQGITRGLMVGFESTQSRNLATNSQNYVNSVLQGNAYLSQRSGFVQTNIGGQQGYSIQLSGRSQLTGRAEIVTIFTTQMRNGQLFYMITVAPQDEAASYSQAFRGIINSVQINE
jgi:Zn-dependent protease with chaperone function